MIINASPWISLPLLVFAGCADSGTSKICLGELENLKFVHDSLRKRVYCVDRLVREHDLPKEHTTEWTRRPPSKPSGRTLHDYIAKCSTHPLRGNTLPKDERPARKFFMRVELDPDETSRVWRFSLSGTWKSEKGDWDATFNLYSFSAYRADRVGKETLQLRLQHKDGKRVFGLPCTNWAASIPENARQMTGQKREYIRKKVSFHSFVPKPTIERIRVVLASPDSFLRETLSDLDTAERRVLDDIAASRNIRRTELVEEPRGRKEMEYRDIENPRELTAEEKQAFAEGAKANFQYRRNVLKENYKGMYASIFDAFPFDEYFAEEPK